MPSHGPAHDAKADETNIHHIMLINFWLCTVARLLVIRVKDTTNSPVSTETPDFHTHRSFAVNFAAAVLTNTISF
jgi:hypothetical protein